jgi:hypothetical protein
MAIFTKAGANLVASIVLTGAVVPALELRLLRGTVPNNITDPALSAFTFITNTTGYGGGGAKTLVSGNWTLNSTTSTVSYPSADTTFTATGGNWTSAVTGYAVVAKGATSAGDKVIFYEKDAAADGFNMTNGSSYAVTLSVTVA